MHGHGHGSLHLPAAARSALDVTRDAPPERNQVDLERIAAGLDTRTTVMIKNIPNKLSDRDLVEYINRVCPRKIDFLYLRMDFQNGACLACFFSPSFSWLLYLDLILAFGALWRVFEWVRSER